MKPQAQAPKPFFTSEQSAREALAAAGSLVTELGDAAILVDSQMRTLCFSPQFASLIGVRRRTLSRELGDGAPFLELFAQIDLQQSAIEDCLQRAKRLCIFDVAGKNARGESFFVIVTLIPVLNAAGEAVGLACIFRDVTAEVALQRSFREMLISEQKKSGELELLVSERTRELRIALDDVTAHATALGESRQREVAVQKSVFAGRLATGLTHEFNTPLACVLANQSYLKSRFEEAISSAATTAPDMLELCTEALEILAEDTSSLQRLGGTISSLQGFCSAVDTEAGASGPPGARVDDILRDVRIALAGSDITPQQVEFLKRFDPSASVSAYRADVGMALVALVQFLLDHEPPAEISRRGSDRHTSKSLADVDTSTRRVQIQFEADESCCVIRLACEQLSIDIDKAEGAFDPSLVVDAGNRVKLSVDLSVSAARIARSGGNLKFTELPSGGTLLEVRLRLHSDADVEGGYSPAS